MEMETMPTPKIIYLSRKEIDTDKWNSCVKNANNSMIYGMSWYLDIMTENWGGIIWGNYLAVLPLPYKLKMGIKYMCRFPLLQQQGLFFPATAEESLILNMINTIPKTFKIIEFNFSSGLNFEKLKLKKNSNFILDLDKNYATLSQNFSSNTKRNIKKAIKNELHIVKLDDFKPLITLKRKQSATVISPQVYNKIEALISHAQAKGNAKIYYAKNKNNETVSACFFLFFRNTVYYLLGASVKSKESQGATFLLFNEFIKTHANTNLTLDFEGSNIAGIARFFSGWGATKKEYYTYRKENLGLLKHFKKKHE